MFTVYAMLIHVFISSSYDPPPPAALPATAATALSPRLPADCRNINVIERRSGGGSPTAAAISAQPPVSPPQAVRACAPQPIQLPPNNNKAPPMEKPAVPPKPPRSRIGGFLSRFANFRFSSRKKQKKDIGNVEDVKPSVVVKNNGSNIVSDPEAVVLKAGEIAGNDGENFVYIPLKPAMGRPPLPPGRQPRSPNGDAPLKKPNGVPPLNSYQQSRNQEVRNNDSVDSNNLEVVLNKLLSAERGDLERRDSSASECYKGGLLETDLDTETTRTVHLVGNRARSLLQLPPPTPVGRSHKSMEYLLDKENLRCVEVSPLNYSICFSIFMTLYFKVLLYHLSDCL